MKFQIFNTLIFSGIIACFNFSQEKRISCSEVKSKGFSNKSNTLSVEQILETEKYDINFYELNLNMTNTSTYLEGIVKIQGKTLINLDSVLIELFPSFVVNNITFNGNIVEYFRSNSFIKIPVNLFQNQSFTIAVDYKGTPPDAASNPLGGSGMTNDFSPSWGNQVTWSLSEPFSAYEWFPCKQSLKDKIDSVFVNITVPENCKAGSNGVLKGISSPTSGFKTFHWEHRHPIDYYLISVAIAEYVDYSIYANVPGVEPILIQNYIYNNPETLPNFQTRIDETIDFMVLFSDIFGIYPFHDEKYGHCMAPLSGGMEHQTMTTQGFFEKSLTAHELAHQWWGNQVTCQSWADIWVNEGFASYAEYLMLENLYPAEKNQDMLNRHENIMSQNGGSIWVEDSLNASRIFSGRLTYDKGAALVHTLRYVINNDVLFFQALKDYQNLFKNKTALGIDVQQVLEEASGLDLSNVFEEWYFGEGFPTYNTKWNYLNGNLQLEIAQLTSMPNSVPFFTNPIDIKVRRHNMNDTIVRVNIDNQTTRLAIEMDSVSNILSIDPNNWIINKVGTINKDLSFNFLNTKEIIPNPTLTIFPNPAKNHFQIKNLGNNITQIKIINPKGQLIYSSPYKEGDIIPCKDFQIGIYQIILNDENNTFNQIKLLKIE